MHLSQCWTHANIFDIRIDNFTCGNKKTHYQRIENKTSSHKKNCKQFFDTIWKARFSFHHFHVDEEKTRRKSMLDRLCFVPFDSLSSAKWAELARAQWKWKIETCHTCLSFNERYWINQQNLRQGKTTESREGLRFNGTKQDGLIFFNYIAAPQSPAAMALSSTSCTQKRHERQKKPNVKLKKISQITRRQQRCRRQYQWLHSNYNFISFFIFHRRVFPKKFRSNIFIYFVIFPWK